MNEHLPECLALLNDSTWDGDCICKALRACETRVLAAAVQRVEAVATRIGWLGYSPEHVKREAIAAIKGDRP
jgi:hypothetical protein